MIKDIGVEQALSLDRAVFVDLRSPVEFQDSHIPGAKNIPLFSDQERSEVGIIYRYRGPASAKSKGLEVVAPRLASMVSKIQETARGNNMVLYCWRGGDRSDAIARVLDIMQVDGYRLSGGYKAYRNHVLQELREMPQGRVVVLHGLTGTGKTEIIRRMAEDGWPAIDLEDLANHRGSVFGGLGLREQPKQKLFDSLLYENMKQFAEHHYLIVESESKKIGKLFLPDHLYAKMREGMHVLVYDNLENRIKRLHREYVEDTRNKTNDFLECVQGLKRYLGKTKTQELTELIYNGKLSDAIRILLTDYYDPLYGYPSSSDYHYDLSLDGSDSSLAAQSLAEYLTNP
ncbi:MAG: tRNA 2-selenouridine(34) synthase MnmH [Syntrophomonadales bacterium]|jgi:tRNA 2-selenouridine synthase